MIKLVARILIAAIIATLLAVIGVNGNAAVLQTLFTVLGIVFSISMSLLVSFSLSKILNKKMRKGLRSSITHARNMLLLDFGVSTFVLVVALIWKGDCIRYVFCDWLIIDVMLIAVVLVATSLIYEIYNFRKLHKLHTDIEDAIIAEEVVKANK